MRTLLIPLLASVAGSHMLPAQSPAARLESVLAHLAAPDAPGVAIIIVKNGSVAYRAARGLANLETRAPLTTETPIYIASIAKQFTAAAILRLHERGKLDLGDALVKHIPELSAFAGGATLRQVLTHTSGLPDHLALLKDSVPGWTNTDVLEFLKRHGRLEAPPGTRVSYSNAGFVMLATVVERVSGQSFAHFLADEFLKPLGMKTTGVIAPGAPAPAPMAVGYQKSGEAWSKASWDAMTYGSGGVYSTVEDLQRWDAALSSGRVLADSTLREASTPARLASGRPTAWGYGWLAEFDARGPLANVWYVASFGSFKGYQGALKRIDDRQFTVIVLTNGGSMPWPLIALAHELFTQKE